MKKGDAIAKVAAKAEEATRLAERFLLAAREMHNSLYDLWDKENRTAIATVHAALLDHKRITCQEGDEVVGWSGGTIQQADTILAVLDRFEMLFEDFIKNQ